MAVDESQDVWVPCVWFVVQMSECYDEDEPLQ